jgi:hypothetical protein
MAKIQVEFDTVEKLFGVTMDGKAIKNVTDVTFFAAYDDPSKGYAEIRTAEMDEENKMVKVTRILANEQGVASEIVPTDDVETQWRKELVKALFPHRN